MSRLLSLFLGLAFIALAGGCSEYVSDYHYAPYPGVSDIPSTQPQEPPQASAAASVIGIHYQNRDEGIPFSVEVRLQVTNVSAQTVVFDPSSLQLTTGSLVAFPPPLIRPPEPFGLGPNQAGIVNIYFPFPPGQDDLDRINLDSLQLRWRVQVDGRRIGQVINFHRTWNYYYDDGPYYYGYPYPYPYPYVGFRGVVVIHGR
jgi:hypothetical protein